ncbi:MAG: Hsp20/alpha crystallin family protein [Candidatus Acidiferrales bacterium]
MKGQREAVPHAKDHSVLAKIGNAADCRKSIRATIAKRAFEIYQRQGSHPGHDRQNWRRAESEILQPLSCGILQSKNEVIVSSFCSAMGAKNLHGIEAVVEPHRLILVGKKRPGCEPGQDANVYRVLPLTEEFDPSSVKLRQRGSLLEIELHKIGGGEN